MNKRGQALVEFVLILPLFILILFAIIDFGFIFNKKSELENMSVDIVNLIRNGKKIDEINKMYPNTLISEEVGDDLIIVKLSEDIDIMTPGLNLVLGDPYKVEVKRTVPNEIKQ